MTRKSRSCRDPQTSRDNDADCCSRPSPRDPPSPGSGAASCPRFWHCNQPALRPTRLCANDSRQKQGASAHERNHQSHLSLKSLWFHRLPTCASVEKIIGIAGWKPEAVVPTLSVRCLTSRRSPEAERRPGELRRLAPRRGLYRLLVSQPVSFPANSSSGGGNRLAPSADGAARAITAVACEVLKDGLDRDPALHRMVLSPG